jgi:hypothetical protein
MHCTARKFGYDQPLSMLERYMPTWLTELLKLLPSLITPVAYATGTFGFFHWLDTKASGPAKMAISQWLKSKQYSTQPMSEAILEFFDRVYTAPLLSWRSFRRSALITICATILVVYELSPPHGYRMIRFLWEGVVGDWLLLLLFVVTNIISDYIALFIVRYFLAAGQQRPLLATIVGANAGIATVILLWIFRETIISSATFFSIPKGFGMAPNLLIVFITGGPIGLWDLLSDYPEWLSFSLPALAVHLWLPFFVLSLGMFKLLIMARVAVGWTQWFIKQGRDHPLDAVGYVAALIVFVTTSVIRYVF